MAIVVAAAAIAAAFAAPAAGAALATFSYSCTIGSSSVSGHSTDLVSVRDARQAVTQARKLCDRGTLEYTITIVH